MRAVKDCTVRSKKTPIAVHDPLSDYVSTENVPYDTASNIIPARRDLSTHRFVCGV